MSEFGDRAKKVLELFNEADLKAMKESKDKEAKK